MEAALDFLTQELKRNPAAIAWARRNHDLDAVRDDPRFHVLLDEIKP